jgi:tRNA G18 (ribose-2'-O)-methylase SpoU
LSGNFIHIRAADDRRAAAYMSIRERELTRGHGARFIVEGKVTLETLLTRSNFSPESLFLAESRREPLKDLLVNVPDGVPIYIAPQEIMDKVVGFPIHRGVLACGWKGEQRSARTLLQVLQQSISAERTASAADALVQAAQQTVLCLMELSNHDNVGACFRNAAAFGADAILLDAASCDPLYRKAIRVSAGAALTVPFAHGGSGPGIFNALEMQGFEIWCLTPRADAVPISLLTRPKKLALVLGAEGPGLPDNLIARGKPVRVPMVDGFDSLNVATAGAIAMSGVFNQSAT